MKSHHTFEFEENLSEDFLSEDASPRKVKVNENMYKNMKMSSLKTYKSIKPLGNKDSSLTLVLKGLDENLHCKSNRKNSYFECIKSSKTRKEHSCSPLNSGGKDINSKRGSLRNDISALLKKSAKIRIKSQFCNQKKLADSTSFKGIKIPKENLEKNNFLTFGVEK
ncbi:unnamed protein product [Moneuplotes crassus]|uniref:Uncharacterized protein n=1 Tax=Euplotes crassus TaxID=5936 RepID=A0AAD1Y8C0_EUPCR|nr:unnamed protein product [Moneuplotes crassus]